MLIRSIASSFNCGEWVVESFRSRIGDSRVCKAEVAIKWLRSIRLSHLIEFSFRALVGSAASARLWLSLVSPAYVHPNECLDLGADFSAYCGIAACIHCGIYRPSGIGMDASCR